MSSKILKGSELAEFLKKQPSADVAYISDAGNIKKYQRGDKGILGNILLGIADPFANAYRGAKEALAYASNPSAYKPQFLTEEEASDPLGFMARAGAGIASNFVPIGKAATALGMAGRGAIAGGLAGIGASDMGADPLSSALSGAAMGGAVSGVLGKLGGAGRKISNVADEVTKTAGVADDISRTGSITTDDVVSTFPQTSKVNKIIKEGTLKAEESSNLNLFKKMGKKINDWADYQERGSFQRGLGAKIKDQTSLKEFQRLGYIKAKDADDLALRAATTIQDGGSKIQPAIKALDQTGISITKDEILGDLYAQLDSKNVLPSAKSTLKQVVEDIDAFFQQNGGELSPSSLYTLKQGVGQIKAKFGSSIQDQSTADLYRKIYFKINDKLDDLLDKNGFSKFKQINKDISTAFDAIEYAEKVQEKAMAGRPLNLMDVVSAAGGMSAGGVPGFALGAGVNKLLQSKDAENLLVKLARGAGNALDKVPSLPNIATPVASSGIAKKLLPTIAARSMAQQQEPISEDPEQEIIIDERTGEMETINPQKEILSILREYKDVLTPKDMRDMMAAFAPQEEKSKKEAVDDKQARARSIIETTKKLLDRLNLGQGIGGRAQGILGGISSSLGYNPDYAAYETFTRASAVALARAMGDTGVLSNQDIQRYISLFPQPTDTKEEAQKKMEILEMQFAE